MKLSKSFKLDIEWWLQFLRTFNGVVYYQQLTKHVVHTDACTEGAGFFCGGDWGYVNWSCDDSAHKPLHINYKEVLAVCWAAERWCQNWANGHVTVIMDSMVAKAIINKGSCRSPTVMSALRDLFWLSVTYNFKLHAIHIPGRFNLLPDTISRLHEPGQVIHLHTLLQQWHRRVLLLTVESKAVHVVSLVTAITVITVESCIR